MESNVLESAAMQRETGLRVRRRPAPTDAASSQADAGAGAPPRPAPLRLLVADHRGDGLGRRLAILGDHGFQLRTTSNLRATLEELGQRGDPEEAPDAIVLLSLSRPGNVELSTLEHARTRRSRVPLPILVVSSGHDGEAAVRTDRLLASGLWDLVPDGTGIEEIALRLRRLVEHAVREAEMVELRHRASHDDRTDLLLPKSFEARLNEHFAASKRHKQHLALVLIDLDRFGSINKDHDHTVGDRLIASVGAVIRGALRIEDVAGRLGGDEFGVILPYTAKIDAAGVVKRLKREILALSGQPKGAKGPIDVSASIGFETFDGSDIDSVETLRSHAERALRVAKVQGGDRGVYYRELDES